MKLLGYARAHFGLPHRQTEGMIPGADLKSKKIVSLKITDDSSHDAAHLPELVAQVSQKGNGIKALADGAYDSENNFSYLYHNTDALLESK